MALPQTSLEYFDKPVKDLDYTETALLANSSKSAKQV